MELIRGLIAEIPDRADYPSRAGGTLNNLAAIAMGRKEWAKARALLTEAVESQRKALALDGKSPRIRDFLRNHLENLAMSEKELGNLEAALAAFREIIAIGEGLVADFPGVPAHRRDLAGSFHNLANTLAGLGRWDEAERDHRRAIEAFEALAANQPKAAEYVSELAVSHADLGLLLKDRGRIAEAGREYGRAIEVFETLRAAHPDRADYRKNLVETRVTLSAMLATCADPKDRDPDRAVEVAGKALEMAPKNGNARMTLGVAQYAAGRWDQAIDLLTPVSTDERSDAFPSFYLAMAHHRRGDAEKARECFARAVARQNLEKNPTHLTRRARVEAAALLGIADRPATGGGPDASKAPAATPPGIDRPDSPK